MDLKGPELRAVEFKQLGYVVYRHSTFGASDSGRIQFGVFQFPSSQQNFVHFSLHVGVPIVDSTRDSLTSQRRSVQPLTDSQGMAPQQSHHNKNCRDLIECDVQTTKCVFSVDRGSGIWPWFGSLNKVRRTWFCFLRSQYHQKNKTRQPCARWSMLC